jgi:hypothetical protein
MIVQGKHDSAHKGSVGTGAAAIEGMWLRLWPRPDYQATFMFVEQLSQLFPEQSGQLLYNIGLR